MFGHDLLVAPVMEAGMKDRQVYLPGGEDWVDLHSGTIFPGGEAIRVDTPLEKIPMFLKNGLQRELVTNGG
jgi:alpha-D-xyloside xylohydrolase